jgi:hypothetical protein
VAQNWGPIREAKARSNWSPMMMRKVMQVPGGHTPIHQSSTTPYKSIIQPYRNNREQPRKKSVADLRDQQQCTSHLTTKQKFNKNIFREVRKLRDQLNWSRRFGKTASIKCLDVLTDYRNKLGNIVIKT